MSQLREAYITHVEAFLSMLEKQKHYSPHTISNYKRDLMGFHDFISDDSSDKITDLTARICRQYIYQLTHKNLSAKSIARQLASFRSFWKFLMSHDITTTNPWEFITTPKIPKSLPSVLYAAELDTFFKAISTDTPVGIRDRAIIELLFASGLRVSELASLNLDQINEIDSEIRLIGKGQKERIVFFGDIAAHFLSEYIDHTRSLWCNNSQENAIFVNQKGSRLSTRSIQRIIKHYATLAGLDSRVTPHTLRHSFATALYQSGADLRSIQELLGHKSLSTTQIYTHLTTDQLKRAYQKSHPRS